MTPRSLLRTVRRRSIGSRKRSTRSAPELDAPRLNGHHLGHGVPTRRVSVRELVELLPLLDVAGRDAVWRELTRLAREQGEPWPTIAIGVALPGLRTAAAKLTRDCARDPEDLDAELVTAFYEALMSAHVSGPMVLATLRAKAYNQVRRMRYDATRYARRTADLGALPEPAASTPYRHPDFVLADAIRARVIDRREAELIGATRLQNTPLSTVANDLGMAITTAWCRRKNAETRLIAWIKENQSSS